MSKPSFAKKSVSVVLVASLLVTTVGPEFFSTAFADPASFGSSNGTPVSAGTLSVAVQSYFDDPAVQSRLAARHGSGSALLDVGRLKFHTRRGRVLGKPFLSALPASFATETDSAKKDAMVEAAFMKSMEDAAAQAEDALKRSRKLPEDADALRALKNDLGRVDALGALYLDTDQHEQVIYAFEEVKKESKARLAGKITKPTSGWERKDTFIHPVITHAVGHSLGLGNNVSPQGDAPRYTWERPQGQYQPSGRGASAAVAANAFVYASRAVQDLEAGRIPDEKVMWRAVDVALDGFHSALDLARFDLRVSGPEAARAWVRKVKATIQQFESGIASTKARVGVRHPEESRYYKEEWVPDNTLRNNPLDSRGRPKYWYQEVTHGDAAGLAAIWERLKTLDRSLEEAASPSKSAGPSSQASQARQLSPEERAKKLLEIGRGMIVASAFAPAATGLIPVSLAFVSRFTDFAWEFPAEPAMLWTLGAAVAVNLTGMALLAVAALLPGAMRMFRVRTAPEADVNKRAYNGVAPMAPAAEPFPLYHRFWLGWIKPGIPVADFDRAIDRSFVSATVLTGERRGLSSYQPVLTRQAHQQITRNGRTFTMPAEVAMITYRSPDLYNSIRQTPVGRVYGPLHGEFFDLGSGPNRSTSVVPERFQGTVQTGHAYDLSREGVDWQKGVSQFTIRLRREGVSTEEYLEIIRRGMRDLATHHFEPRGLVVLLGEDYVVEYVNFDDQADFDRYFRIYQVHMWAGIVDVDPWEENRIAHQERGQTDIARGTDRAAVSVVFDRDTPVSAGRDLSPERIKEELLKGWSGSPWGAVTRNSRNLGTILGLLLAAGLLFTPPVFAAASGTPGSIALGFLLTASTAVLGTMLVVGAAVGVAALVAKVVSSQKTRPSSESGLQASLKGVWALDGFDLDDGAGNVKPWSQGASGTLTYTDADVTVDIRSVSEPGKRVFYTGRYRVEGDTVVHDVTSSSDPGLRQPLRRTIEMPDKDHLTLVGPFGNGGKAIARWRRSGTQGQRGRKEPIPRQVKEKVERIQDVSSIIGSLLGLSTIAIGASFGQVVLFVLTATFGLGGLAGIVAVAYFAVRYRTSFGEAYDAAFYQPSRPRGGSDIDPLGLSGLALWLRGGMRM